MSSPYLGEIRIFTWDWAPRGWALCNGALLSIQQNTALFSLLGTTYGGNGVQTFALPDLRGRVALHRANNGTYSLGEIAGTEQVTISQSSMAAHNHLLLGTTTKGDKRPPKFALASSGTTNYYYSPPTNPVQLNPGSIGPVGGNLPHPNVQPFLVINYCIATNGLFPSRN